MGGPTVALIPLFPKFLIIYLCKCYDRCNDGLYDSF